MFDERCQLLPERRRVLLVQVDLIPRALDDHTDAASTGRAGQAKRTLRGRCARSRDTMAWINMQATLAIILWTLMMAGTLMRQ